MPDPTPEKSLLQREAEFWDRQEEEIDNLYARPHDWRFIPKIAHKIIRPRIRFMQRLIAQNRGAIGSVLDIGCGNGWFCHAAADAGITAYGVDLSPKKVETARRLAAEKGVADRCHFFAGDVMDVELDGKVDLLTAQGSLHHFPDLENVLPEMVDRFLAPEGFMLFSEPHHEGMSPGWQNFILGLARRKFIGRLFDVAFYLEVTGQTPANEGDRPETAPDEASYNVRGESPAGLEFFGEEPDMGEILAKHYEVLDERFFHYFSGHLTNALYVYMKSRLVRGVYGFLLPVVVAADTLCCRFERYNRWAEEGVWFLRRRPR